VASATPSRGGWPPTAPPCRALPHGGGCRQCQRRRHHRGRRSRLRHPRRSCPRAGGAALLAKNFTAELTARYGRPSFDILVNNAGLGKRAVIEDITEDDFDLLLQTNLKSPFFLIKALLPHLRDGGRIVNISSMGTRAAYPSMAAYAPAKGGA